MTQRRRPVVLLLAAAVLATLLPFGGAGAQEEPPASCARGVLIEGRCLSIDGAATDCLGDECIEFVEDVTPVCPDGFVAVVGVDECEQILLASQRPDGCPDGARGEVNDCHIFVAKGPDGCPNTTFEIESGDCKKPVANAWGAYYCEDEDQQLQGRDCRRVQPRVPSDCPAATARFDAACWRIGSLSAPETCDGYGLADTIALSSGRCRVPELIFTGSGGCIEGTELLQGVQWVEYEPHTETSVQGPLVNGCTERGNVGIAVASCLFNLDRWGYADGDVIDGVEQCTRYAAPDVAECGSGYSKDDSLGGVCARFAPVSSFDPPECPEGWAQNGLNCVEAAEFEAFACPAGMTRNEQFVSCREFRPLRTTWICNEIGLLASDGCWAFVGPQPNVCNALGTVDDCYRIDEPVAAACQAASGCIALGDFTIRGDVDCDGDVTIIDALLIAQHDAAIRDGAGTCVERVPASQLYLGDGDVNDDSFVDIIDALLVAQCDAGLPVLEGCV